MGDGRAEGSSAIGDRGHAAVSLTPDVDETHIRIFESSKLAGLCVGHLLYTARLYVNRLTKCYDQKLLGT